MDFPGELLEKLPEDKREAVLAVLADDPRPGYQNDPTVYGMTFADWDIRFTVDGQRLLVCEAVKKNTCKRRADFIK